LKLLIKHIFLVSLLINLISVCYAQPCKTGWSYRQKIGFVNPGVKLANFQVNYARETNLLVASSKAQLNASDIRIVDENNQDLNFWIDDYNTSHTKFWVKMDSLAANDTTFIYLFYGKTGESSQSNGEATFEFFDDFDGTILSSKWSTCNNNGSNVGISGGNLLLNSSSSTGNISIISDSIFSDSNPVHVEMDLVSVNNGKLFLGIEDVSQNGLGITYNDYSGTSMIELETSSSLAVNVCRSSTSFIPDPHIFNSLNVIGTWSFSKFLANSSYLSWPGGFYPNFIENTPLIGDHQIILSTINQGSNSDAAVDWVRARKYSSANISYVEFLEEQVSDEITVSNSGPYCEGDDIFIVATNNPSASYSWKKDGVALPSFNGKDTLSITNSTVADDGNYSLEVSIPSGCPIQIITTSILVNSSSLGGFLNASLSSLMSSGVDSSVHIKNYCPSSNLIDTIFLNSFNGAVSSWQSSDNIGGPWNEINNINNYYSFSSLSNSKYFRAILNNNVCPSDTSNYFKANIYNESDAGYLIGNNSVCEGYNSGSLELINHTGEITWQKSIINSSSWTNITGNNTNILPYNNLTDTTIYRALVNNENCINDTSNSQTIMIYPKPLAGFSYLESCEGTQTIFNDTSTLSVGQISNYNWNFGSGIGSNVKNPQIIFPSAGLQNVLLVVTSNFGCVDSIRNTNVSVNASPSADFTFLDGCDGDAVIFTNNLSLGASFFSYDFGDGIGDTTNNSGNAIYTYPAPSSYNVKLVVESSQGCKDSIFKVVNVFPRVNLSFLADSVCLGQSINFVNTSQTTAASITYQWNFGDGSISGLNSPSHIYTIADTFSVNLQSNTNNGCNDSFIDTVIVYPVPNTSFSVDSICLYDSAQFINLTDTTSTPNLVFNWDFGNGSFSNLYSPSHLYLSNNNYNITLTSSSDDGCSSISTKILTVGSIPNANFSLNDICLGESITFQNSSSPGGLNFNWDFGDNIGTSSLTNPTHSYLTSDTFDIELITITSSGCSDTILKNIIVSPLPYANFNYSPVCYGSNTLFYDSSHINSPDSIISYLWDFGDGTNSIVQDPVKLFLNDGTYNVELSVVSNNSCSNDTIISVVVNPFPISNFTFTEACVNDNVNFTNQSSIVDGSPLSFSWVFGDGDSSILENPSHIYTSSGLKNVRLFTTSNFGCVDSIDKVVEAFLLPSVYAGLDTSVSKGYEVQLMSLVPGGINFNWSPIDGLNDNTIFNPIASPLETTNYILEATDVNGCINSDTITITVINDFKLLVNNIITPDGNGQNDTWVIENIKALNTANVHIYNKRGRLIYFSDNYQNDWNGFYGDDELPDGTYYYVINFTDSDSLYRGSINLLRNK